MVNSSLPTYLKKIPLWVYLLLLGFITFYTRDIRIAADMGWYMNSALNMFLGKGYTDTDGSLILNRAPIFPFMITVCYWLLGVSSWSAFWVVRIFCILNPIIIYFLGKRFFGKGVGFSAALLILTSYSVDFWSYRHIDAVWPFFVLAANYLTYLGFEKGKLLFFIASGVCLGIAVLIKEVAVLFLPLPLLIYLWIAKYRKKELLGKGVVNIMVTLLIVMPWFFYLWHHESLSLVIGRAGPLVAENIVNPVDTACQGDSVGFISGLLSRIEEYGSGFTHYYYGGRNSLNSNFILAPGFLVAWLFLLIRAIKGDGHAKILVLNLLLFLPILFFVGRNDLRLGQSVFFLLLSYLGLSAFLRWIVERMSSLTVNSARFRHVVFCLVVACLLSTQVFAESNSDFGYSGFFKRSVLGKVIKGEEVRYSVNGAVGDKYLSKAIQAIKGIATENEAILMDWHTHATESYFGLAGKYPVSRMPILWCSKDRIRFGEKPNDENEKPLWIHSNGIPLEPRYRMFMLFESHLIEEIEKKNIKYVFLTPKLGQLKDYFSRSLSFEEVMTLAHESKPWRKYRIYRVVKCKKLEKPFKTIFTNEFKRNMAKLRSHGKERYEYFRNRYIYGLASIVPSEFRKIELDFR